MARKTKPASRAPLFVAVCALALVGGLAAYIVSSPGRTVSEPRVASQDGVPRRDVKVYTPRYEQGDLKLDPATATPGEHEDPMVFAVNTYLSHLKMVPSGARAKTCTVTDGVANLDFTPEFETTYGTEDEQTVLKGLLTVMAQFSGVRQVKFTVAGRTLESIGNVDLTTPQDVLQESPKPSPAGG